MNKTHLRLATTLCITSTIVGLLLLGNVSTQVVEAASVQAGTSIVAPKIQKTPTVSRATMIALSKTATAQARNLLEDDYLKQAAPAFTYVGLMLDHIGQLGTDPSKVDDMEWSLTLAVYRDELNGVIETLKTVKPPARLNGYHKLVVRMATNTNQGLAMFWQGYYEDDSSKVKRGFALLNGAGTTFEQANKELKRLRPELFEE